jgi:arabinan endo-1,5-alpha-L-arabinosidase
MRRVVLKVISLSLAICIVGSAQSTKDQPLVIAPKGDTTPIHDPTMIRVANTYYVFATNRFNGKLIPIFCSLDLQQWKFCGNVFDAIPEWAQKEIPGTRGIWAPDISYAHGEYRLYYSISTFGSNRSAIGLITNSTLDSNSTDYRWVDKGLVVSSTREDDFNAIDPNYIEDKEGNSWLAFGSFWGGIKLRRLDKMTGKLSQSDSTTYSLASRRPLEPPAIEAPAIIRRDGYYYLFVSFDFCCKAKESTYKIAVGRSARITGPYLDRDGKPMLKGGGTILMQSSEAWRGPGGQSVWTDSKKDLLVFHSYNGVTGKAGLMLSPIVWEEGWPKVGTLP